MNSFEKHYQQKNFDIIYTDSLVTKWMLEDKLWHIVILSFNNDWGLVMKEVPDAHAVFVWRESSDANVRDLECPSCHGAHTGPKEVGQGGCNRCNGEGVIRNGYLG